MPEHERELGVLELAVEDMEVGAAHPAGRDLDEDLMRARLWHRQLHGSERLTGPIEHHRLHRSRRHDLARGLGGFETLRAVLQRVLDAS